MSAGYRAVGWSPGKKRYACAVTIFETGSVNVLRLVSVQQGKYVGNIVKYIEKCCAI